MSSNEVVIERPRYTEKEINSRAHELPGFKDPSDVFDIFENETRQTLWQPVLSTTIVTRFGSGFHVLTGNRTSIGNNTHVNVASTPTIRVPYHDAGRLLGEGVPFCLSGKIDPQHPFVSESLSPSVSDLPDNSDVLGAKVGNLLSLKLQFNHALESAKQPVGRTSLAQCVVGFSYLEDNPSGEALYEPLIMFGAVVGLDPEIAKLIPEETSSYSHLGWTPIDQYVHGVATKTTAEVISSAGPLEELEVCVRGLCNATSSTIVSDVAKIQAHLTENGILPDL